MAEKDLQSIFGKLFTPGGSEQVRPGEKDEESSDEDEEQNCGGGGEAETPEKPAGSGEEAKQEEVDEEFEKMKVFVKMMTERKQDPVEILKRIPMFSGSEDLDDWLFKVKITLETHSKVRQELLKAIHFRLSGKATQFYRVESANCNSFKDLERLFRTRFQGAGEAAVESAYNNCVQEAGESVRDYAQKFKDLANKLYGEHMSIGPVERGMIRQFIGGLNADIQRWVCSKDPASLDDAVEAAVLEERAVAWARKKGDASGTKADPTATSWLTKLANAARQLGLQPEGDDLEEDLLQAFAGIKKGGQARALECFKCGKIGHMRAECPNQGAARKTGANGRKCQHCDKRGHSEDDCFVKKYGTPVRKPGESCAHCKREGHVEGDCYFRKMDEERRAKRDGATGSLNSPRP